MKQRSDYHANNESDSNQCARADSTGNREIPERTPRTVNQGAGVGVCHGEAILKAPFPGLRIREFRTRGYRDN